MINYVIREVEPDSCELSRFFDDDGLTSAGGDWNYNLFIVYNEGWGRISGFNIEEYKNVMRDAYNVIDAFSGVGRSIYSDYSSYKDAMDSLGIPYNSRKCHALKEWAKNADESRTEDIAAYLTITTGEEWDVTGVHGYSQGDYVEVIYCKKYHTEPEVYGEVYLGCAKEFGVIEVEDYQEPGDEDDEPTYTEKDSCWGYIVADSQAWTDEDYKRLVCEWACIDEDEAKLEMIDGWHTYTHYSYRTA